MQLSSLVTKQEMALALKVQNKSEPLEIIL
jgi:hypothetical protein